MEARNIILLLKMINICFEVVKDRVNSPVCIVCQAGKDSAGKTDSRYCDLTPPAINCLKPSRSWPVLSR